MAVYIAAPGQKNVIPLMLENTSFMLNVGSRGALIKGGALQEIYSQFSKVNSDLLQKQDRIMEEHRQAQLDRDIKKMQALRKQFEDVVEEAGCRKKRCWKNTRIRTWRLTWWQQGCDNWNWRS